MNDKEQMEFFHEIFDASLPRLGPGDDALTRHALDTLLSYRACTGGGSGGLRILDLGCGNGAQSIQLAKHAEGTILAVDNHQPFLDELVRRADAEGVSNKIQIHLGDMRNLELPEGSFDLIWSEGALFVMGFREGLEVCRQLLAPGGMLAVSELAWLRSDTPDECRQFFKNVYPAMADIDTNLATIRACGYTVLEHFTQPDSAWWQQFYHSLEERLTYIRAKYSDDAEKMEFVKTIMLKQIDIFRKYSRYYGNEFYLMHR